MIKSVASRRMSAARGLLCSTAIAAALALTPQIVNAGQTAKSSTDTRWALPKPLPADVMAQLLDARWKGSQHLIAGVFDKVRERPAARDAVVDYARNLQPNLLRDLTRAADLAVLTANDRLTLAPNAGAMMNRLQSAATRTAAYADPAIAASSRTTSGAVTLAVPANPPTPADQTWHLTMIGAQTANGLGFTGAGVTVAVGDSGFDLSNDAFVGKFDLTRARNYVINTPTTPYDSTDVDVQANTDQHGSHVAGIIAATQINGMSMRGVAYGSTIVPIRLVLAGDQAPQATYPEFDKDPFEMALRYFAELDGVKIYNASYGTALPRTGLTQYGVADQREYNGAITALAADKLIVVANGNQRDRNPTGGANPSGLALLPFVRPEHAEAGVYDDDGANYNFSALLAQRGMIIAVTALGTDKSIAPYSQYCGVTASWCVAAPGGDMTNNLGVYSTVPVNTYAALQGTSMAAPVVSGALAVLLQAYPDYSARDLARLMFSTAEDLGPAGLDAQYGYGLIRLDRATAAVTPPADGGAVNVATNATTYWAPEIVTPGSFEKTGDGILTVSGRTYAQGSVHVTGGTLAVDGTLAIIGAGNTLDVSGGALAGFGDVIGNTVISGILSPGKMPNFADNGGLTYLINSPGTLSFYGNVTLTASAMFGIAIDGNYMTPGGPGTFSKVNVVGPGNVFIANGSLNPVLRDIAGGYNTYTPKLGSRFQIVTTANGATTAGSFTSLTQPAELTAGTQFSVLYTTTTISLLVSPVSLQQYVSSIPLSPNAQKMAAIVDANKPGVARTSNKVAQFFDTFYQIDSPQNYAKAFEQLGAGAGKAASASNAMDAMSAFGGTVGDRVGALESGADMAQSDLTPSTALAYGDNKRMDIAAGTDAFAAMKGPVKSTDQWSTWGRAFGRWSKTDDNNGASGGKSTSGGVAMGMDRLLAPDLIGGAAVSYTRTNSSATDSTGRFDSYAGALYATWSPNNWVVNGRASLGYTKISTARQTIITPTPITGDTDGLGVGLDAEVGYRIRLAHGTIKPFAGLGTQLFNRRGYTEASAVGLTYPSQNFTKVTSTLGAAYSTRTMIGGANLLPELRVGWGHDWRDSTLTTQAALLDSPFTITSANPGRDAALLGLSLTAWKMESTRFFVAYNGEYRAHASSHQASGGFRYSW